jgi:hypothetical protein
MRCDDYNLFTWNHSLILTTAPHQSRKKRELTRAVELLETKYGGERVPHRLLSGPTVVLANVFASVPPS